MRHSTRTASQVQRGSSAVQRQDRAAAAKLLLELKGTTAIAREKASRALVARSAGLFSCAVVTRNTQLGKMPADRNGHANCVWPSRKTAAPRAAWLRRVEQLCLCSCERASIRPLYARIALRSFTLSLLTEKRKKTDNARLGGLLQSTPTTRTSEPPRGEPTRGSMGEGGGNLVRTPDYSNYSD